MIPDELLTRGSCCSDATEGDAGSPTESKVDMRSRTSWHGHALGRGQTPVLERLLVIETIESRHKTAPADFFVALEEQQIDSQAIVSTILAATEP